MSCYFCGSDPGCTHAPKPAPCSNPDCEGGMVPVTDEPHVGEVFWSVCQDPSHDAARAQRKEGT
jgi:hypothetical protein